MITRLVTVQNPEGLHMRPADKLVRAASGYQCQIELERCGQIADCRSMIGLLTLGAPQGSHADLAVEAITRLFDSQFDDH
jgi:phosphotransferase system HPr (HPr) family protein